MKGESMRTIGISLLGAALALIITVIAGCAGSRQSSAQQQADNLLHTVHPGPVEGLCKSPDLPPADVAHKPGYRQFDVSVTDSSGRPISALTQRDFVVYAGSQTFPVTYFREHKNDEPVAIALVVDTSGSMTLKLPVVKQSLGDLVTNLNRCDEVVLFAFSSRAYLLAPFSTDHQMTAKKLELFHAYGQTALYDATNTALQSLANADYPNRKMILITDGMDNVSTATQQAVVADATKDGVPIYAVGIGDPNAKGMRDVAIGPFVIGGPTLTTVDAASLEALSAATGRRGFIVPATSEDGGKGFKTATSAIADSLGAGYAVGAVIPADANLPSVYLAIVNRRDLVVRARLIAASP